MAKKRKKKPPVHKARGIGTADALQMPKKKNGSPIYRCLECKSEGNPREMLVSITVGDHEMPNGRMVPGGAHVRSSVCRFCYKERMKIDGAD